MSRAGEGTLCNCDPSDHDYEQLSRNCYPDTIDKLNDQIASLESRLSDAVGKLAQAEKEVAIRSGLDYAVARATPNTPPHEVNIQTALGQRDAYLVQLRTAEAKVERLREALKELGVHKDNCHWVECYHGVERFSSGHCDCTCGLDAALRGGTP